MPLYCPAYRAASVVAGCFFGADGRVRSLLTGETMSAITTAAEALVQSMM